MGCLQKRTGAPFTRRRCDRFPAARGALRLTLLMSLFGLGSAPDVVAQGPLNIEQLIMKAQRWQMAAGMDHHGRGSGILDEQVDRALSAALRYGVRGGVEVNARYTLADRQQRFPGADFSSRRDSLTLGVNWQLRPEDRWPAVLLEVRGEAWERQDKESATLPGGSLALTVYRTIDPLVLSLRGSYDYRARRRHEASDIRPGDAWRLEPMVNFAVNPQVTLIGGLAVSRRAATRIDGLPVFAQRYRRELLTGIGYAPRVGSTVFLIGSFGDSASGSGVSVQWLHEFM